MRERTFKPPVLGIAAAYFFCFMLVFWPIFDFFSNALPFQLGRMEWRYAAVGLMGSYLITPIMGVAFAMLLASLLRHRVLLRFLSVLCLLGAAFLLLAMVSLGLDVIQLWRLSPPEGIPSLRTGGLIAEMKHLSGVVAVSLFGLGGWQASRRVAEQAPTPKGVVPAPGAALKSETTLGR
jgi:hypothetical protein